MDIDNDTFFAYAVQRAQAYYAYACVQGSERTEGTARQAARDALQELHSTLSQRGFFAALDALGGQQEVIERIARIVILQDMTMEHKQAMQSPLAEIYHPAPYRLVFLLVRDLQRLSADERWYHPQPAERHHVRAQLQSLLSQAQAAFDALPPDSGRDYTQTDVTALLRKEGALLEEKQQ